MIPGEPKTVRCGRPSLHSTHQWVPHPKSRLEFTCDGRTVEPVEVLFDLAVSAA